MLCTKPSTRSKFLEMLEISVSCDLLRRSTSYYQNALIAATCKYYGIRKIATFDEDFERVYFLEVVEI